MKKIKPGPGQESVWDYPRPPRIEPFTKHIRILMGEDVIFDANHAFRILETSHPPTYYLPTSDFAEGVLQSSPKTSYCEFKGMASYYHIQYKGQLIQNAAWYYLNPNSIYAALKDHVSVYAHMVTACYVDDELVQAQPGYFYGGWITSNIVGPFKGGPGTWGW